jgi:predicted metallo-beta-lactamase superfamily hydrolase
MRLTDPIIREGPQLQLHYVAFDSFGVKSMCVRVKTPDLTVTIDPGVAAEANSFPLPVEKRQALLDQYTDAVHESCAKSQAVVISHYHLDHLQASREMDMYGGKTLLARDPAIMSANQAETATKFFKTACPKKHSGPTAASSSSRERLSSSRRRSGTAPATPNPEP